MRSFVSSLLIVLGLVVLSVGVGAEWGTPAGLIAGGATLAALGVLVHGVGESS